MNSIDLLILPGDGIGPEVMTEAFAVLDLVSRRYEIEVRPAEALIGGAAIDAEGGPISPKTLEQAKASQAVLLGAVGGEKWDALPPHERPERGLLELRSSLDLYANLRPIKVFDELLGSSTLRPEVVKDVDMVIVRELVSGIYFGEPRGTEMVDGRRVAYNTMRYSEDQIERVARLAFELAQKRRKKVTSADKANVLEVSQLWRKVVDEVAREFSDVELQHQYIDNCAMQLIRVPQDLDIILAGNMFGDILSDEAAMLTGSIGMLPSASIGRASSLYEPVHGSAPDIAGQGKANPIAMILSAAMMLELTCKCAEGAEAIRSAVAKSLADGYRTADIHEPGSELVTTSQLGELIRTELSR